MTTIFVTPAGGFNQTVNLSCANPPTGYSCTFGPPSVTPNGGVVSSTLTIVDGLAGGAARTRKFAAGMWPAQGAGSGGGANGGTGFGQRRFGLLASMNRGYAIAFGGELTLFGLLFTRRKKLFARAVGRTAFALIVGAMAITFMTGCAGSSPTQTTTITVNATAGATTVSVPLTVTLPN